MLLFKSGKSELSDKLASRFYQLGGKKQADGSSKHQPEKVVRNL
jgi:hypothetical protein